MSGKMLLKLHERKSPSWMLDHQFKLAVQFEEYQIIDEYELESAKGRYFKIWISNYVLFIGLWVILLALLLKLKTAVSFIAMSAGILVYYVLFLLNHENRIRKNEDADLDDYEHATAIIGGCSKIGLVYAIISVSIVIIFY